jgi:hypothetical protein
MLHYYRGEIAECQYESVLFYATTDLSTKMRGFIVQEVKH